MIYVIGSLKKDRPKQVANLLREKGWEVFDDWGATAYDQDTHWTRYEREGRGRSFREALEGKAAVNAFEFDYTHLIQCRAAVMVMPCGKSGHLELGWVIGRYKPGFILLDGEPAEYELMYKFATGIAYTEEELVEMLEGYPIPKEGE